MPEVKAHEPGTPSWVDLGSKDPQGSAAFYGSLFGWQARVAEDPGAGGYTMFLLDGKEVAAVGPLQSPDQPGQWSTYVSVDDADATASAVSTAGGSVLAGPFDVFDAGRMAVLMDDGGAAFSVWQPRAHTGAELVNEPGTLSWNELATRDVDKAKAFYGKVFGWDGRTTDMGGGMSYTEFRLGSRSVAGMRTMGAGDPDGLPPHWLPYFAVDDTDGSVTTATKLGGAVMAPAMDIEQGRFAVLADPFGATFAVIKMAAPGA